MPSNVSMNCSDWSVIGDGIIHGLFVTRLVLLAPLSVFILNQAGFQWKQQRSFRNAAHSDIFTYNLAAMEMFGCLAAILYFSLRLSGDPDPRFLSYFMVSIIFFGETGFHVLTCIDRYLAVVHPVKYQALRASRGASVRNSGILSVWFLPLFWSVVSPFYKYEFGVTTSFLMFISSLLVVSVCSLAVLRALRHPAPGSAARSSADQSKRRAFVTMTTILGALCLVFLGFMTSTSMLVSNGLCKSLGQAVHLALMWFSLPSSLVLPLLHLHKTGKLPW